MDLTQLEISLEAALSNRRPSPRDVRDALVDYYAAVTRPFIERGLAHTHPKADDGIVRRLLMLRLASLWKDAESPWSAPTLTDLEAFRLRIERYACVAEDERLAKSRRLLDDLMLAAKVGARLGAARQRALRRLRVIPGGGEASSPRGTLHLVRSEG